MLYSIKTWHIKFLQIDKHCRPLIMVFLFITMFYKVTYTEIIKRVTANVSGCPRSLNVRWHLNTIFPTCVASKAVSSLLQNTWCFNCSGKPAAEHTGHNATDLVPNTLWHSKSQKLLWSCQCRLLVTLDSWNFGESERQIFFFPLIEKKKKGKRKEMTMLWLIMYNWLK